MFITSEKINNIIGTWKFTKDISQEQLEEIAKEWAKDPRYISISVRNASKEQLGINFEYCPDQKTQKVLDAYCSDTSDYLKRQTGNGLIGWDISSHYFKVK